MRMAHLLVPLLLPCAASPAGAGVLYKSVDAKGTVMFSDMPPPDGARIVEQREIGAPRGGSIAADGTPRRAETLASALGSADFDAALERANADVDQAEHELALARRDLWSPRDGLRLTTARKTAADEERVAFYQRNLLAARRALLDLVRERRNAVREPGAPIVVSGGPPLAAVLANAR